MSGVNRNHAIPILILVLLCTLAVPASGVPASAVCITGSPGYAREPGEQEWTSFPWNSSPPESLWYAYGDSGYYLMPGTAGSFDDVSGNPQTQGWTTVDLSGTGVGDFAQLMPDLTEYHSSVPYSQRDLSHSWTFINDGVIVPGLPPAYCDAWCYGPLGYILEFNGGYAGPGNYLHNQIVSPAIPWSPLYAGALLRFEAFIHETLAEDSPGMVLVWRVRSSNAAAVLELENETWYSFPEYLFGGPRSCFVERDITPLIRTDAQWVQVSLGVQQVGEELWGINGNNGTPAPYIDNVAVLTHGDFRPAMMAMTPAMAQDAFPVDGQPISPMNLADQDIPFNVAGVSASDPGDSVSIVVTMTREDGYFTQAPLVVYKLYANPLFHDYRDSGLPNEGTIPMSQSTNTLAGSREDEIVPSYYADFPDDGFLFPGDILHYYFMCTDDQAQTAMVPSDTTGFSIFPNNPLYDTFLYPPEFTVRGLPTVSESVEREIVQPRVLIWLDATSGEDPGKWSCALRNLGLLEQVDFDIYFTNCPSCGLGNGLMNATAAALDGYHTIIYSSGTDNNFTLTTGDEYDVCHDLYLLDEWLRLGGKNLVLFGDNLAAELADTPPLGLTLKWSPNFGQYAKVAPFPDLKESENGQAPQLPS